MRRRRRHYFRSFSPRRLATKAMHTGGSGSHIDGVPLFRRLYYTLARRQRHFDGDNNTIFASPSHAAHRSALDDGVPAS